MSKRISLSCLLSEVNAMVYAVVIIESSSSNGMSPFGCRFMSTPLIHGLVVLSVMSIWFSSLLLFSSYHFAISSFPVSFLNACILTGRLFFVNSFCISGTNRSSSSFVR